MENNKQPEIRFNGFHDEWKETKLEAIADSFEYGLNASAKQFDGINKYIRITDIDDDSHKFLQKGVTSPNIDLSSASNYLLQEGDILFARTGASVGKTYIYEKMDGKVYYAGFLIRARINARNNPIFIFQNTLTSNYNQFIQLTSQRSGQPGVNAQEYANYSLMLPTQKEQDAIGVFLKKLDDIISIQQQELDTLKQTKQGFLQKMFPKEGETVPEVRFDGFHERWNPKKLNEITDIVGGGTPDTNNPEFWDGEIDWYSPREIGKNIYADGSAKKITSLGLSKSSAKILPANRTILFTSRAGIGDAAILEKDGSTNQGFQSMVVHENHDVYFLYSMKYKIKEYALKNASGSTFLEVSGKILGAMTVLIPSFEEQIKIGEFFRKLDKTIELQEKELEALKETKKAFLQKMFV